MIEKRYVPRSRVGQLIANRKRKLKLLYATPGELPPENDGAPGSSVDFSMNKRKQKINSLGKKKFQSHFILDFSALSGTNNPQRLSPKDTKSRKVTIMVDYTSS